MSEPLLKVVVTRSNWLRGEGPRASCLLRPSDGRMCCLGFVAIARGLTHEELSRVDESSGMMNKTVSTPAEVKRLLGKDILPGLTVLHKNLTETQVYWGNSDVATDLMTDNDNEDMSDERREGLLRLNGLRAGIDFEFVD